MYGWQELAMLSKCANPECSEIFKYLHQGKIFRLAPIPEVETVLETIPSLHERFWLCDNCSKGMTVVWDGTQVKLAPLPIQTRPVEIHPPEPVVHNRLRRRRPRARAAP